jgi:hypothetical protein
MAASHGLLIVGPPEANVLARRLAPELPIHVVDGGIELAGHVYRGREVGTMFIHPNPEHPAQYVVLIEAPTRAGLLRALSLPRLLPDFVVYDHRVALARGQMILRHASILAGGMFDEFWRAGERVER